MGTGKFSSPEVMKKAIEASGAEIVTVGLRRPGNDSRALNNRKRP